VALEGTFDVQNGRDPRVSEPRELVERKEELLVPGE
jgi:hypothetical protein